MSKTINEILKIVDNLKPNPYDIPVKLQWINEVDGNIWTELFQYKKTATIELHEGITNYELPEDANFNRITNAYFNDMEIPKLSNAQFKTTGISRGNGNTINLYPLPQEPGELTVVYLEEFVPYKTSEVMTKKVLAESPFDKLYIHYLTAMIDFHRQEYSSYNNTIQLFNASFVEYAEWLVKNGAIERRDWTCNSLLQNIQRQSMRNVT